MGIEVVCHVVDLGVDGDPAVMIVVMLRQVMEAEGMGGIGHDQLRTREYRENTEILSIRKCEK